jgi:hypothetical protein
MYLRRAELKWDFIIKYYWREGMKIKQAFADVKLRCLVDTGANRK